MDKRKWLSRLFLLLFFAAILLPIPASMMTKRHQLAQGQRIDSFVSSNGLDSFDCGCLYVSESYIHNSDIDHYFSLFPYAFYHSELQWPGYGEDCFKYRAGYIWYSFTIDEINAFDSAALATPIITFPKDVKGNRSRVYEKDHVVYTENDSKALLFHNRKKVCELPSEDSFFDPICINGIDGAGILILSQKDPSQKSTIRVYTSTGGTWVQAQFQLSGQTAVSELEGYVRRHVDMNWETYTQGAAMHPGVGAMEVGIENSDGSIALYTVTYADGKLNLELNDTHPAIPPEEWIY